MTYIETETTPVNADIQSDCIYITLDSENMNGTLTFNTDEEISLSVDDTLYTVWSSGGVDGPPEDSVSVVLLTGEVATEIGWVSLVSNK